MLDASLIQQLKRTNISKDAEKTKQRFGDFWKAASVADKETIESLTGVVRPSLQRIYKEGSISAKVVAAASQVLNVDPYYLTGETDEPGESSESILIEYLKNSGYQDLLKIYDNEHKARKTRKKREAKTERTPKSETSADNNAVDTGAINASNKSEQTLDTLVVEMIIPELDAVEEELEAAAFFDEFDEDVIMTLIRSIKIRANAGVADAIKQAEELRKILLS